MDEQVKETQVEEKGKTAKTDLAGITTAGDGGKSWKPKS